MMDVKIGVKNTSVMFARRQTFYWFCALDCVTGLRVGTWLMAGSGGQGRHGSCRLLPGSPQAWEIGSEVSE